jgi:hypothetical protein
LKGEQRSRQVRGIWWLGAAALAGGGALLGYRLVGTGAHPPAAPAPATLAADASPAAAPVVDAAARLESLPSTAVQAASREIAASVDLREVIDSESCGSAEGRAASLATLASAETAAARVHELVVQSVAQVREAVDDSRLDARTRDALRQDVEAATERTLMLAGRTHDIRLQAISTARSLVAFMEENAGGFEVRDGFIRFSRPAAQDQFNHFQVNTARVLAQEMQARNEMAQALVEQEALLARAQAN